MNLKPETLRQIDDVIPHYPVKRSAMLPLLHLVQEDVGYISPDAIAWIAGKLELEPINVYEVVTFYPMFRQKPIGRRHIKVCRTLSCALLGGYKSCRVFEQEFSTHRGEISPDGEVTVDFVECLASCGTAPVVLIDDDLHENVDATKAKLLSDQIKQQAKSRNSPVAGERRPQFNMSSATATAPAASAARAPVASSASVAPVASAAPAMPTAPKPRQD